MTLNGVMAVILRYCSCYIMKLCSRLFVLYCRSRPKDDKSRHFDPQLEEVRGGVEPWWMARWKGRAEFLLSEIEPLPGRVRILKRIISNNFYAHDDQGDNPGQENRGLDGVLYKL